MADRRSWLLDELTADPDILGFDEDLEDEGWEDEDEWDEDDEEDWDDAEEEDWDDWEDEDEF